MQNSILIYYNDGASHKPDKGWSYYVNESERKEKCGFKTQHDALKAALINEFNIKLEM